MQFKVPQNIDMQDRIIGPLTLSQFFYLLFGGLIIYILFSKLVPVGLSFLFWIMAIPIGLFSFAMAFLKVNDRPFPFFFIALIKYMQQPKQRIWQHYAPIEKKTQTISPQTEKSKKIIPKKQFDTLRVDELAKILDKPAEREK